MSLSSNCPGSVFTSVSLTRVALRRRSWCPGVVRRTNENSSCWPLWRGDGGIARLRRGGARWGCLMRSSQDFVLGECLVDAPRPPPALLRAFGKGDRALEVACLQLCSEADDYLVVRPAAGRVSRSSNASSGARQTVRTTRRLFLALLLVGIREERSRANDGRREAVRSSPRGPALAPSRRTSNSSSRGRRSSRRMPAFPAVLRFPQPPSSPAAAAAAAAVVTTKKHPLS